jgi:hypothetical protein
MTTELETVAAQEELPVPRRFLSKRSKALVLALLPALSVAGIGWVKALDHSDYRTAARSVRWLGPHREALAERPMCAGDIHLAMVVDGPRIWTVCSGALAQLDLVRGEGRIAWRFPTALEPQWTVGVLPGPGGRLAIVSAVAGGLSLAIAGPSGWVRSPAHLPGGGALAPQVGFLGMAFRGDTLEVAVRPTTTDDDTGQRTSPIVIAYPPSGAPVETVVSRDRLGCPAGSCIVQSAYLHPSALRWHFLLYAFTEPPDSLTDVSQDGTRTVLDRTLGFAAREAIVRTSSGALVTSVLSARVVQSRDGRITPLATTPAGLFPRSSYVAMVDGELRPMWRFTEPAPLYGVVHAIGTRTVVTRRNDPQFQDPALDAWRVLTISDVGESAPEIPARIDACTDLPNGVFLPRPEGGFWLVDASGCYIALDASLRRADPRGLLEHLSLRGSGYHDWREPSHPAKLLFVLLGLLVLVPLGLLAERRRAGAAVGALWLYTVSAALMLVQLWPLLR